MSKLLCWIFGHHYWIWDGTTHDATTYVFAAFCTRCGRPNPNHLYTIHCHEQEAQAQRRPAYDIKPSEN